MSTFAELGKEKYISVTTFKRDGTPVSTPVWCASDDGQRVLVHTASNSWKVRRIRRNSHVRVTPCSGMGKPHGAPVDAEARIVTDTGLVEQLLRRKYGLVYRLVHALGVVDRRLRGRPVPESVTIEITAPPTNAGF